MTAKLVVAIVVGALSGMLAATGGELSPPPAGPRTLRAAATVAQVVVAAHPSGRRGAP